MQDITKIIGAFADIGVSKEKTLEIMHDLLNNSAKYADNEEAVQQMIQEKLTLDEYISFSQHKII
jgi:hypothetical protein